MILSSFFFFEPENGPFKTKLSVGVSSNPIGFSYVLNRKFASRVEIGLENLQNSIKK